MLHKNLPIYKAFYDITDHMMRICLEFPKGYKYTLGERLQNVSLSLIVLFYETKSGIYEKKIMITKMRVAHEQLTVLVRLAVGRDLIKPSDHIIIQTLLASIGKQLTSRSQKTPS